MMKAGKGINSSYEAVAARAIDHREGVGFEVDLDIAFHHVLSELLSESVAKHSKVKVHELGLQSLRGGVKLILADPEQFYQQVQQYSSARYMEDLCKNDKVAHGQIAVRVKSLYGGDNLAAEVLAFKEYFFSQSRFMFGDFARWFSIPKDKKNMAAAKALFRLKLVTGGEVNFNDIIQQGFPSSARNYAIVEANTPPEIVLS